MSSKPTTRRHLLALSLFACAGATLPASAFAKEEPTWLTRLSARLDQLSVRMHRQGGAGGEIEFHCEIRDAATWAGSFSKLAVPGTRVRAGGNVLAFSRDGHSVRVIMSQV